MATNLMAATTGPVALASLPSRLQKKVKKFVRGLTSISNLSPSLAELRVVLETSVAALPMEGKGGEVRAILAGSFEDVLKLLYEEVKVASVDGDASEPGKKSKSGRKGKGKVKDMKVRRREGERREGMHGRRKGGARWRRRRTVQPSCDSPRSPARTDPPNHPNPIRPRPPPNPQRAPLPVRFPLPLPLLRLCE